MTTPSSRMDLNFLLQSDIPHPNPSSTLTATTTTTNTTTTTTTTTTAQTATSSWSDRSDLSAPIPNQSPKPLSIIPPQSVAMMQLANAAALASRASAPLPVSPVSSSQSTSYSIDQQIITPPPSPPPTQIINPQSPPTTSRSHRCNACSQTFTQKVRFLHHLYTVHNIRTYETRTILPCSKCDAAFLRNTDRSKHDLCVHQRLRPFRCEAPNCSSSFFFAKDLTKHRSTVHLRHKPFVCSICPKAFGKREHMTSHIKRVHQKLRPFKCDVCDIRLASKYNLQGHLKTAAHAAAETLANRDAARLQYLRRAS